MPGFPENVVDELAAAFGEHMATPAVQTLTVDATGGTYTLAFNGSAPSDPIAENANAAAIQAALESLTTVTPGDLAVTGAGPFTITFLGSLGDVPAIVTDPALLTGGASTAVIVETTQGDDPPTEILKRPLRHTDPALSLGIYAYNWVPNPESAQIGQNEPALATYLYRIQLMVKHATETEARALFTSHGKIVRAILYRDTALRVRLAALQEDLLGSRERFMRFGVRNQSFLNNELRGAFVYLATTDLWVETETADI
jgi:hypothetical protein